MSAFEATDPAKVAEREHIDQAMRDYLASGKPIEKLARGEMAETGWTARQRCNPNVATAARREEAKREREARTAARKAEPLPRFVRERAPPKPRVRKPPPRKVRTRNGPEAAREGTRNREALDALREAKLTAAELALKMGWGRQVTATRLQCLKKAGLVTASGSRQAMRWSAKA